MLSAGQGYQFYCIHYRGAGSTTLATYWGRNCRFFLGRIVAPHLSWFLLYRPIPAAYFYGGHVYGTSVVGRGYFRVGCDYYYVGYDCYCVLWPRRVRVIQVGCFCGGVVPRPRCRFGVFRGVGWCFSLFSAFYADIV